jgi:hypothetical protein
MGDQTLIEEQRKLIYKAPELIELGDVRDITLGASPGTGDSLAPGNSLT